MCAPNLKSAASSDPEILRGPEISKLGTFPRRRLLAEQFVILGQDEPRIHVRTKFEQRSFIRSTDVEGVPKIRNSARTPGHAHLGANLWSECKNSLRLHVRTKFENRGFIRPRDIEGVPKFRNWARTPGHAHLGANFCSCTRTTNWPPSGRALEYVPNFEFLGPPQHCLQLPNQSDLD